MNRKNLIVAFAIISAICLAVSLYGIFMVMPVLPASQTGFSQKIFYWHLPTAIVSFIAFMVTFFASILYLLKRDYKYDVVAYSAAELGLVIGTMLMIFGVTWDYLAWGVWWTWDVRLTTYLILLLLFGAYFFLRSMVEERSRRATYAAVFGIIAALDVPISFFSTRLIKNVLHPVVIGGKGTGLEPSMYLWLAISMVGFLLLFVALLLIKNDLEKMKEALHDIKDVIETGGENYA
jgi:heme exporter protein C